MFFFFFKQKTAYEMRISDWSSDVCSSDLLGRVLFRSSQHGVEIEKILITHGHIDHCGEAGTLAKELGVSIEGPHEADRFWISRLGEDGRSYGVNGAVFEPDRWLNDGDKVTVGNLSLDVIHCPGHTPGH